MPENKWCLTPDNIGLVLGRGLRGWGAAASGRPTCQSYVLFKTFTFASAGLSSQTLVPTLGVNARILDAFFYVDSYTFAFGNPAALTLMDTDGNTLSGINLVNDLPDEKQLMGPYDTELGSNVGIALRQSQTTGPMSLTVRLVCRMIPIYPL